jgi:hypothetical protein
MTLRILTSLKCHRIEVETIFLLGKRCRKPRRKYYYRYLYWILLITFILIYVMWEDKADSVITRAEHRGRLGSTPVSLPESPGFKSRHGYRVCWLKIFVIFFSPSRKDVCLIRQSRPWPFHATPFPIHFLLMLYFLTAPSNMPYIYVNSFTTPYLVDG